jgi:hypothetical protein
MFKKYQHIERFGTDEVEDIELGNCHIFAKIDGTNGTIWKEDGDIHFGSRNRDLENSDNQGFKESLSNDKRIIDYLTQHPDHRIFGEWLVPHSLKTYRDDAWRKFYIFDVCVDTDEGYEYLPYEVYSPMLDEYDLDYIPLMAYVKNGSYEQFIKLLESNTFLVKDGLGAGEGIVIKNYSYRNKYGRMTWAKIVRAEFREVHSKTMGAPIVNGEVMVEEKIVEKYVTTSVIEKEYQKIVVAEGGWKSQYIPRLLSLVYHELITEDMWNITKEFKNPRINFKTLNNFGYSKDKDRETRDI